MNDSIGEMQLSDIIRELEETMDKANLLALELALRGLEDMAEGEPFSPEVDGVHRFAECAANTTNEIERLIRRVTAA